VSRPARFSQQARREVDRALRDMTHAAARQRLREAVVTAARRLGANPLLGSPRPHLGPPYRCWSLTRFGYLLVYDPRTDPVEILRFVHTRRDLPRVLADLKDAPDPPDADAPD
jgi:plasmid stabilization system protein ParE